MWRRDYPLTDAAKKSRAAFNPLTDTVAPGCRPKGMPTIMEQPYPMEFVRKGDAILLRLEEYDTVRTIDMAPRAKVDSLPKTLLGRSTGRWDGETLIVTTSRIDWPYFDPSGIPQGPASTIEEAIHADERWHASRLHDDHNRSSDIHLATRVEPVVGLASGRDRQTVNCVEAGRSR